MAFEIVLTREIKPGIFNAKGFFDTGTVKGDVDVLVKKLDDEKVQLILDSNIHLSKMMDREVLKYTNVKPEVATPSVVTGAKVKVTNKIWFNLKKNKS